MDPSQDQSCTTGAERIAKRARTCAQSLVAAKVSCARLEFRVRGAHLDPSTSLQGPRHRNLTVDVPEGESRVRVSLDYIADRLPRPAGSFDDEASYMAHWREREVSSFDAPCLPWP